MHLNNTGRYPKEIKESCYKISKTTSLTCTEINLNKYPLFVTNHDIIDSGNFTNHFSMSLF